MQIETTRFGTLDVMSESIIRMPEGMIGFGDCKSFILLEDKPGARFRWFQSIDRPDIAFMVINPSDFFEDYEVELSDVHVSSLELTDPTDAVMFTTATVDMMTNSVTTNLIGPIVINAKTLMARQIVLQDDRYTTKHRIGEKAREEVAVAA